jgi:type IV pilus assembly protein PilO
MSTAVAVPPPNSSSLVRRLPRLTAQARALLTAVNLHFAGVAALLVLAGYFAVRLFLVWQALGASNADALASQRASLRAAQIAAAPLRGMDQKLATSTHEADTFYAARLPYADSQIAAELHALTRRSNVRLSRIQLIHAPGLAGPDALTEVKMDASISGDYRPTVELINALERDKMFFVINGISLTGQQTGQVNLRLRMTTYLRLPSVAESTTLIPVTEPAADDSKAGGTR